MSGIQEAHLCHPGVLNHEHDWVRVGEHTSTIGRDEQVTGHFECQRGTCTAFRYIAEGSNRQASITSFDDPDLSNKTVLPLSEASDKSDRQKSSTWRAGR